MNSLLAFFIIAPLFGFIISLLIPNTNEKLLSWSAFGSAGLQLTSVIGFVIAWLFNGAPVYNINEFSLYATEGYDFFIDLYFDKTTAVFLFVGALLTFLITLYSKYYLHKESGYKRFFNTILFFYLGYNIIILSGNFETLFIGWEILGISSFLLIAFYRERFLPTKNAMKVFSIYRLGDIALILAMWLSHHLWHQNITFYELNNFENVAHHIEDHTYLGLFISLFILLAAIVKSAQFPFSFWLSRAMEGPTPSSAIFYSSLSVHIGVFILLRTFTFWEHVFVARILVAAIGIITIFLANPTAKVQSSVKAQVAYASVAQIGLIFIEIALGLDWLALIHFAGNAFLRTYQLLVSPSVVTYLIRDQFFNFKERQQIQKSGFRAKLSATLYVLSLKEWGLDSLAFYYLWLPFKRIGNILKKIPYKLALVLLVSLFLFGAIMLWYQEEIPTTLRSNLPIVFSLVGLTLSLRAFTYRESVLQNVMLIIWNHFWIALAVTFNEHFSYWDMILYLSGVIISGAAAIAIISWLKKLEPTIDLNRFHGHAYEYKTTALIFLLSCLGLSGFPITPTFIGEDLIFSHIHVNQILLLLFVALSFVFNGLSLIRIFARIFMGPHIKAYHPTAHRSA